MATDTLNEFISLVRSKGLLTNNKFYVVVPGINSGRDLVLLCDAISVPGYSFASIPIRIFGEETNFPHTFMYDKVQMTFLIDKTMIAKQAIDAWMNQVMNRNTRFIGYYSDYVKEVDIFILDKAGNEVLKTTLHEAYPIEIQAIQLSNEAREIMKVQVSFVYKWVDYSVMGTNTDSQIVQGVIKNEKLTSIEQYVSNNQQFQSQFGASPVGMGNFTQMSQTGPLGTLTPGSYFIDTSGPFPAMMENYGTLLPDNFNRTAQIATNAYSLSSLEGNLSSSLIVGTQGLARDMRAYGTGVTSIGQNYESIHIGAGQVSGALQSISNNLSLINVGLDSVGAGTPFDGNISALGNVAASFRGLQSINDLPSRISGSGTVFSSIGATFNNIVPGLSSRVQLDTNVTSALRRTGSTFITAGVQSQSVANDITSRISLGAFL